MAVRQLHALAFPGQTLVSASLCCGAGGQRNCLCLCLALLLAAQGSSELQEDTLIITRTSLSRLRGLEDYVPVPRFLER